MAPTMANRKVRDHTDFLFFFPKGSFINFKIVTWREYKNLVALLTSL
jgi:hypothetical protein